MAGLRYSPFVPAKAGTQRWIPACAGMSGECARVSQMNRYVSHPGRLLKRELASRKLSANRLSLDIGVPSGRVTDILNARRSITTDTAVRLGRYFGSIAFPGQVGTGWPGNAMLPK